MADKYGSIFSIKMGVHRTLVVNNWEIAKECFTTNDKVFCNRPKALASEILGYNYAGFGSSPYGPYWCQIRKLATLHNLSNHRLEMFKHVRESVVKAALKEVYDLWVKNKSSSGNKVLVEMKSWFGEVTEKVILRMVVRKRFVGTTKKQESEENERFRKAARRVVELVGAFALADAVPFLRWLDLDGIDKAMKKTAKEFDQILQGLLEAHKQKGISGEVTGEHDFMGIMLSILIIVKNFRAMVLIPSSKLRACAGFHRRCRHYNHYFDIVSQFIT